MKTLTLSCLIFLFCVCGATQDDFLFGTFPENFQWGAGSSAYQIEGGATADGKGESIWDVYSHKPNTIPKNQNGDIASDSYHLYQKDVQLLKDMGAKTYRFSISWSRIMPTGASTANPIGIQYYKNLIQELKTNNIEPIVTMFHDDLPQDLQRLGGWLNRDIVSKFIEYSRVCFTEFGADVKHWITIHEPLHTVVFGYAYGSMAPGVWGPSENSYIAAHNMLLAHVGAYRLYQQQFKDIQQGRVGLTLVGFWLSPQDAKSQLDQAAQERGLQFSIGWFANPLLINGDYPQIMKQMIQDKSPGTGSRLPSFTGAERVNNMGAVDFFNIQYHTTLLVTSKVRICDPPDVDCDDNIKWTFDTTWNGHAAPNGIRKLLQWMKTSYNISLYVSKFVELKDEQEMGTEDGERVAHMKYYINEVMKAVQEDQCDVQGFIYSSLLDGFEYSKGFSVRTGLHHVDFWDKDRPRSPKASAMFFKQLIHDNGFHRGYSGDGGRASGIVPYEDQLQIYFDKFPENFVWGVGTSAYKVEGAWNTAGRGKGIWDTAGENNKIMNSDRPSVSSDQYNHYLHDVQLIKDLGVSQYLFSISWSRIYPDGATYNSQGMEYYKNLIAELQRNGIDAMVVLHDWDLPQALQDMGGWVNSSTIDSFITYAQTCFTQLGDQVKLWVTFSDPNPFALHGYGDGLRPPYSLDLVDDPYIAAQNILLAHTRVYRLYQNSFKSTQNGQVGININFFWTEPKNPLKESDVQASRRYQEMFTGWFMDPIFGDGNYPEIMRDQISRKSRAQGLSASRLPTLSDADQTLIKNSYDFLGMNYLSQMVAYEHRYPDTNTPRIAEDNDVMVENDPNWLRAKGSLNSVAAFGIRKALNWVKYRYGNPSVYVTANGYGDTNGTLIDEHRIHYYRTYINSVLKAIKLDECNVKGYFARALVDGFEGVAGYSMKYGFYSVNFSLPERPRTRRGSAHWYSILTKENAYNRGFTQKGAWGVAPQYVDEFYYDKFPDNFIFSTATSAAQIEGAWNTDGKGYSIWDTFAFAGNCRDGATPEVACDSYHNYKQDVTILKNLGVQAYRFSISWPRVMPDGTRASRNQLGIDYYNNVINELLANNIKPVVTIYHWDLPQALEDYGGWLNRSISERFREYAALLFEEFGDRVDMWITLNEPWVFTVIGYGTGDHAPGLKELGSNPYLTAHNAIRSHAEAYRYYHNVYKGTGRVGITLNIDWVEPEDPYNMGDVEASENGVQTFLGWFANPIYLNGDYPEVMKEIIARNSAGQNLSQSRLPEFTEEEKQMINGSSDFFGMNSYTSGMARAADPLAAGKADPNYFNDRGATLYTHPSWTRAGSSWLYVVPWGIRRILNWVKNHYNDPEILITENGVSDNNSTLDDYGRVYFFQHYMNEVLKAAKLDDVNVMGYTAWSVLDNFEWAEGYAEYFGLYSVDFSDPKRPRTPKMSSNFVHQIIKDQGFLKDSMTDPHRKPLPKENEFLYGEFPEKFSWGASSTAYEIEGGYEADGKGQSTLDAFFNRFGSPANGNMAADSYHKYMEDIKALKEIKAKHYYMSISWSRILPDGTTNNINQAGIDYYQNLFKELHKNQIFPVPSLFSWDLPNIIQTQYGGWLNESTIDLFENYARLCFEQFGPKVMHWVTMNEPEAAAFWAYEYGALPPGQSLATGDMYRVIHNLIKAHVRVYHMYHREFARTQGGEVGINLRRDWFLPKDHRNSADNDAVWRYIEFDYGGVGDPLLKTGDYPDVMRQRVRDRLPQFTLAEQEQNKGACDFLAVSHFTTYLVSKKTTPRSNPPTFFDDADVTLESPAGHLMVHAKGIRMILRFLKDRYGNIPTLISGNGVSQQTLEANNMDRKTYIKQYTNELLKAIKEDGCDVRGYSYYPLLDGFNWATGYDDPSGLLRVDFDSSTRNRSKTASSKFMEWLATDNGYGKTETMTTMKPDDHVSTIEPQPEPMTSQPSKCECPTWPVPTGTPSKPDKPATDKSVDDPDTIPFCKPVGKSSILSVNMLLFVVVVSYRILYDLL